MVGKLAFSSVCLAFYDDGTSPGDMHLESEVPASLKGNSSAGKLFSLSAKFRLIRRGGVLAEKIQI